MSHKQPLAVSFRIALMNPKVEALKGECVSMESIRQSFLRKSTNKEGNKLALKSRILWWRWKSGWRRVAP